MIMRSLSFALMPLFLSATAASAAVITTNDRATFEAQFSPLQLVSDPFANDIAAANTIIFDSGVISANSSRQFSSDNRVLGGDYNNTLAGAGSNTIVWTFPTEVVGFGFDVVGANSGGAQVSIDDGSGLQTFSLFNSIGATDGFAAFTGMGPFSQITFSNAGAIDSFSLDNLVFAVPEPTAAALLGLGLAGLAVHRRRLR